MGIRKVLIIVGFMELGGAQRVVSILSDQMVKKNIAVKVVSLIESDQGGYKLNSNVEYEAISRTDDNKGAGKIILTLHNMVKRYAPDAVMAMGVPTGALYAVPAMIGLKPKLIISERADPANFRGRKITKIISHKLLELADGYVFQTNDARDYYNDKIKKRSTVILNPIGVGLPDVYTGKRRKCVIAVGRLAKEKNHKLLINAFADIAHRHKDYCLYIFGEGSERESLERLIVERKMTRRIQLKGLVAGDILWNDAADAGIYVLSSDNEGMPNALLEAMAMGLPCISTDCPCGGPKMVIEDGVNGILIPVGDRKRLSEALEKLLSAPDYAKKIGKEAEKIRDRLSEDKICKQWLDFFEEQLNK